MNINPTIKREFSYISSISWLTLLKTINPFKTFNQELVRPPAISFHKMELTEMSLTWSI